MLYTVNTDENGYILSVAHTKNDSVELDLEKIELKYLNAYQLKDGVAVLDEEKKAEIIAEEEQAEKDEQIMDLTNQLKDTDEDLLSFIEDIFTLKNPLTFITDLISLMSKYTKLVADRVSIRKQIEELKK